MLPLTLFAHAGHTHSTGDNYVAAGLILSVIVFTIFVYIITSVLLAQIFKKAGVDSWKAWVPVYSTWVTLELGEQKGWWAVLFLFPFINLIAMVFLYIAMYNIGLRLGKDGYFVLWAIFLPYVWYAWLALDKSTWQTPHLHTIEHPENTTN